MAKNLSNLDIGIVDVYVTQSGQPEYDLGYTWGGAELMAERDFEPLQTDQGGETPVDLVLKGNNLKVKVNIAEPTTFNLNLSIPEGRYNDGSVSESLGIGTDAGYRLRQDAVLLRLHPHDKAASDLSKDIYIWKAVSSEPIQLNLKRDEQKIVEVTFTALYDDSWPDGQRLGRIGPSAIS